MRTRDAGAVARMLKSVLNARSATKMAIHRPLRRYHGGRGVDVGCVVWVEFMVFTTFSAQRSRVVVHSLTSGTSEHVDRHADRREVEGHPRDGRHLPHT